MTFPSGLKDAITYTRFVITDHLYFIIQTYVRKINRENSDLGEFQFFGTLESLGITGTDFTHQVFVDRMPVNAVLICRVSGLTFTPTNGEFYLRATCTGYPESKRIEFEAIEMSSSLSGIYKARYSAPAGTKWIDWKTALTNADLTDVIADLKAEANKGLSARRIVQCDTNTLNTPFKAGLTNGASGTAFICMSSSSYGTILYIVSGSEKMFMLCKTNGTWGNWIAK